MGHENALDYQGLTSGLAEVSGVLRVARRGSKVALSDADAATMLADAVAGRAVALELTITPYIQRDTPNRNFVRFSPAALRRLAPSYAGQPFLRNHDRFDVQARGGTIVESKLVDHADGLAIEQVVELTAPWAVEQALRKLIDRFSIGWHRTGILECSVCHKDMLDWRGRDACPHWPGDKVEVDGATVYVEAIFTGADGTEVSTVNVPAVVGTEVQGIRAALEAARNAGGRPNQESRMSSKLVGQLLTILALSADTTDEGILASVGAMKTELGAQKDAAERAQRAQAAAETELAAFRATGLQADIEALMADAVKKIGQKLGDDGKPVEGEVEKALRQTATSLGIKAAREMLDRLPRIVPVARGDRREDPTPATKLDSVGSLSEAEKKAAKSLGVSEAAFLASKNRLNGTAA